MQGLIGPIEWTGAGCPVRQTAHGRDGVRGAARLIFPIRSRSNFRHLAAETPAAGNERCRRCPRRPIERRGTGKQVVLNRPFKADRPSGSKARQRLGRNRRRQIRRVGGITLTEQAGGLHHPLIERCREDVLSRESGANLVHLSAVAACASIKPFVHHFIEALGEDVVGSGTILTPVGSARTDFSGSARTDGDRASGRPRPLTSIEI